MSGTYNEYKQLTNEFIQWIIETAGIINNETLKLENDTNNISVRVDIIINSSDVDILKISSKILNLKFILNLGSKAVGLRKAVHQIYKRKSQFDKTVDNISDISHAYFIQILNDCHCSLMGWYKTVTLHFQSHVNLDNNNDGIRPTNNIYELLLPEEEEDIRSNINIEESLGLDKYDFNEQNSKGVNIDMIDKSFDDLKLTILCFFIDIANLFKRIRIIWKDVATEKKHILIATTVTMVAFQTIDHLYAMLQLKYPSIKSGSDLLFGAAKDYLDPKIVGNNCLSELYIAFLLHHEILSNLYSTHIRETNSAENSGKACILQYDRNSDLTIPVLVEQESILPMNNKKAIKNFMYGSIIDIYNSFSNFSDDTIFSNKNNNDRKVKNGSKVEVSTDIFHNNLAMKSFLFPYLLYFKDGIINFPLLWRSIVWLKIIEVMQNKDNLTMGRIIYLTRQSTNKYLDFFNYNGDYLKDCKRGINYFNIRESNHDDGNNTQFKNYELYYHNPFLTGARLLDLTVSASGTDGLMSIPRNMCHMYSALKSEGYIKQNIPFFEVFINTFREFLFSNVNQIPSKGNYLNSSLIKSNFSLDFISAFKKMHLSRSSEEMIKTKICRKKKKTFGEMKGESVSKLVKILECDFTQLDAKEFSMMEMIDSIEDVTHSELFCENRVLSLHCLKCLRIFYSIYIRLKIGFFGGGLGDDNMVDNSNLKNLIFPFANALNMHFLKFLDEPNDNAQTIFHLQQISECLVSFLIPMNLEKEIYVFDTGFSPLIISVFGTYPMKNVSVDYVLANCSSQPIFQMEVVHGSSFYMELIGKINNQTSNEEKRKLIEDLKDGILNEPNILIPTYDSQELSSILDVCIVKLQDQDLLEWLIQMKGLLIRGDGRKRVCLDQKAPRHISNSHLAVAVRYDADWAVDIILASTQGKDISQSGFTVMNSVFHECAIKDKIEIYHKIFSMTPMMRTNDNMESPFDLAKGPKFKEYFDQLKILGIPIEKFTINNMSDPAEYNQMVQNHATPSSQTQEESRSDLNRVISSSTNIKKSLKKESSGRKAEVTSEEIARVAQNERELLAMWGDDGHNDNKKNNKKKGNNNTKK